MRYSKFLVSFFFCSALFFVSCGSSDSSNKTDDKENTANQDTEQMAILLFSKTSGFRHSSIPTGIAALQTLAKKENWKLVASEDSTLFNENYLEAIDVVIFLNTTGDILAEEGKTAFVQYVNRGGAFVGIHSATDTEYQWPWYQKCVAAAFESHPEVQEARLLINKADNHPAIAHLPEVWTITDEWYYFQKPVGDYVKVLISLDETSIEGKEPTGQTHPMAWYHHYEGGRVFYTGLGHTEALYQNPDYIEHLKQGITWAGGLKLN